ncbi:MAG: T9SS type A sorting domain-containing protein [Bacteroidetes bacterium]|nr:T9SS type A sorting domain-containing protein [Bacteroidota bacterium]
MKKNFTKLYAFFGALSRAKKSLMMSGFTVLSLAASAQFTQGNVVVLQAGDGTATLTANGSPIVLKEFTPLGAAGYSLALPTTTAAGSPLVISGTATSEGLLTLSSNPYFLIVPGYANTFTASISGASGTNVPRAIGRVDAAGTFTRVATSTSFYSSNNMRGATSDGIGNYWGAGSSQGTNYFGVTSSPALVQNLTTNTRGVAIYNSQLYYSTSSGTHGIYKVGTGTPVTTATSTIAIATGSTSSPYQFAFNATGDVCYVADDASISAGGGIQKWTYSGSAWSLAYTFATSTNTSVTVGARGLTVNFSGANPVIYATSAEASANRLISIIDGGSVATSTITTLATATTNCIFRGVAFSPSPCNTPTISGVSVSSATCANLPVTLSGSATGSAPLSYSWTGTGTITAANTLTATVNGASNSNYTLSVNNACGTATSVVTASVNALPTLTANATSTVLCPGQSVTLSGSGASTYTWGSGVTDGASFTPTATAAYTVTGTNASGCSNSATVSVTVNTLPNVSATSATICPGQTASLTASGATTYTWNTSSTGATLTVTPTGNTGYTVTGADAAGCTNTATATVTVHSLPNVTATSATICVGATATLTASGATSYTWNTSATTASITDNPASTTGYTVTGTDAAGCTNTATAMVMVNSLPNVSATSATICSGSTATLTASGATSYIWNTSATTASITDNPASTTGYTVTGTDAAGCTNMAMASITVNNLPSVTATSATICTGSTATLVASGAITYSWSTGATTAGISDNPTTNTSYTVTGTDNNGCSNSSVDMITVNSLPTLSMSPVSSPLCANNPSVALSATPTGGVFSGTGVSGNSFDPSIAGSGTYTITYSYTDANSCSNTSAQTVTVSTCTGITENTHHVSAHIYPNPAQDVLHITVENVSDEYTVDVFDALGNMIYHGINHDSETSISTESWNKGLYVVRLTNGKSQHNYKLIKQ